MPGNMVACMSRCLCTVFWVLHNFHVTAGRFTLRQTTWRILTCSPVGSKTGLNMPVYLYTKFWWSHCRRRSLVSHLHTSLKEPTRQVKVTSQKRDGHLHHALPSVVVRFPWDDFRLRSQSNCLWLCALCQEVCRGVLIRSIPLPLNSR